MYGSSNGVSLLGWCSVLPLCGVFYLFDLHLVLSSYSWLRKFEVHITSHKLVNHSLGEINQIEDSKDPKTVIKWFSACVDCCPRTSIWDLLYDPKAVKGNCQTNEVSRNPGLSVTYINMLMPYNFHLFVQKIEILFQNGFLIDPGDVSPTKHSLNLMVMFIISAFIHATTFTKSRESWDSSLAGCQECKLDPFPSERSSNWNNET